MGGSGLERITAYLERGETALTPAPLKADPPKIFVSTRPALLVVLDGAPVMAPVPGTDLSYTVNTNWDLLRDGTTYYLRHEQSWLTAPAPTGGWKPAGTLPPGFSACRRTTSTGRTCAARSPAGRWRQPRRSTVFVSETPAELILLQGEPKLAARVA